MQTAIPSLPTTIPEALARELRGIHVLVVDPERNFREVVGHILRHVHMTQITQAGTLSEARQILAKRQVSLVLSEFRLPDGTGLDLVKAIRGGTAPARRLPVILLTGELDRLLLRRAINAGVDDCLVKPLRPITLYQRISRLVQRPPVYVEIPGVYFGPDRRRRVDGIETVEDRRRQDTVASRHAGGIILDDGPEEAAADASPVTARGRPSSS
ncbi:response regulator [Lutibaculum baratangense]|uniref:Chemotaxis protein CheYIII n=1 Tax=Lutibaculum baratangense AMV1 TaxID=631454 RepID=V4QVA8_9HYPH|nr:response regulator [Lutibaculum baratangense]ESR23702.1 chemotaxis protein CheYIII [Lutibaculum baratangense AMV1]